MSGYDPEDDPLTLEDLLITEGITYRTSNGNKGIQLNVRECFNPNCGSDKWKVYINQETSLGNCFSCGEGLNTFKVARWLLEDRGGHPTNQDVGRFLNDLRRKLGWRPKQKKVQVDVAIIDDKVELPTSGALPYEDGWNHPYLEGRGINGEWAKRFHLRFSAFGRHYYTNTEGKPVSQDFEQRIIIPVINIKGELVTFQGRDVTGMGDRYLFAGGLPGTGRYIYNSHVCAAKRSKEACMGEGAFDVIKTQIALNEFADTQDVTAIGSWGKHLSSYKDGDDQMADLHALKKLGLEQITIMWDGEEAAYDEALVTAERLMRIGFRVKIAILPAGKDPGELDARVIHDAYVNAKIVTRLSLLRMKMSNPYKAA